MGMYSIVTDQALHHSIVLWEFHEWSTYKYAKEGDGHSFKCFRIGHEECQCTLMFIVTQCFWTCHPAGVDSGIIERAIKYNRATVFESQILIPGWMTACHHKCGVASMHSPARATFAYTKPACNNSFSTSDMHSVLLKPPWVCSPSHANLAPGWMFFIRVNFQPIQNVGLNFVAFWSILLWLLMGLLLYSITDWAQ